MGKGKAQSRKLAEEIREAFANTKYPGDDRIVYDNSGYDMEAVEIANKFRGKKWQEIPFELLFCEWPWPDLVEEKY
jgi:hypothetical protein